MLILYQPYIEYECNIFCRIYFNSYKSLHAFVKRNDVIFINITSMIELVKNPEEDIAYSHYEHYSLSVELVKNDQLQKVYFRCRDKVKANVVHSQWISPLRLIGLYVLTHPHQVWNTKLQCLSDLR